MNNNYTPYYKLTESTKDQSLEAAIHLLTMDFTELPKAGDESIATQLFIDRNAKVFWFTSPDALKATSRIIRLNNKAEVQNITLEEIQHSFSTPVF